jgi:hypothetical protein
VTRTVRIAALMIAAVVAAGCKRVVPLATTRKADWAYVDAAWGGTKLKSAAASDQDLTLTLALFVHPPTRLDSAICNRGVHARQDGGRIILAIDRSVCGHGPNPLTATMLSRQWARTTSSTTTRRPAIRASAVSRSVRRW